MAKGESADFHKKQKITSHIQPKQRVQSSSSLEQHEGQLAVGHREKVLPGQPRVPKQFEAIHMQCYK